jgi:hypothetical protein
MVHCPRRSEERDGDFCIPRISKHVAQLLAWTGSELQPPRFAGVLHSAGESACIPPQSLSKLQSSRC